jgi:enediyne biosynthesis protein E4
VFPEIENLHIDIHYKDCAILYRNLGDARFRDISAEAGAALEEKHSSRGAAFGDIDNDGTIEVAVNNQNEAPSLLKQTTKPAGHWTILQLTGTVSNRSAIGACVKVTAGGHSQIDEVRSGGSYLSQSDLRLHFGIGNATQVDQIEIKWPSGQTQVISKQSVDRIVRIREPYGPKAYNRSNPSQRSGGLK